MKKVIKLMLVSTIVVSAWEINTHRAIDRIAIEKSQNLKKFIQNSGISTNNSFYNNERFEDYGTTYLTYIQDKDYGEENGVSKWNQTFNTKPSYQKMIEAGTILEDAVYKDALFSGDGRFNNHFYDPQNGGHALTIGYGVRTNAAKWASVGKLNALGRRRLNQYSFESAFYDWNPGESNPKKRRKSDAKMLVTVGHLMHMVNDMSSTAHVRDDSHPFGDPLEVWTRGGESGRKSTGFRVDGSTLKSFARISRNPDNRVPKYSKFSDFITQEAYWTATHFFSAGTVFTKPKPAKRDTYESRFFNANGLEKYYIKSDGSTGIPVGTKLAIRTKSYIINALKERFYTSSSSWMGFDKSTSFRGNYSVIEENARILIPRAIANARNFLDYFFRGQISAKITDDELIITNVSDTSLVARGVTTLRKSGFKNFPGNYNLLYEDNDGTRHRLNVGLDWSKEPHIDAASSNLGQDNNVTSGFAPTIDVAPGHSIKIPIVLDYDQMVLLRNKKIIVFFSGYIGSEKGKAVCYASTPSGHIIVVH